MATPIFSANDLSSWYGSGTLTSQPWQGTGTTGLYGSLSAPTAVGTATPYQFTDINAPNTPNSADYRPAVAKGAAPLPEFASLYGGIYNATTNPGGLLDAAGNARAAIALRGKAGAPVYTSQSAINAYGLSERAKQEAAAGKLENRERGNTILAGYDQSIANNRKLADTYQTQFDANQAAALSDLESGYGTAQSGFLDRYNRNMATVNQFGDSQRSDLMQNYQKQLAAANQSAIRRGLGNTTVRASLDRGVTSDFARNNLALEDSLLQNRLRTDQTLSGDYLNSLVAGGAATSGLRERQGQYRTDLYSQNLGRENQGMSQRLGFLGSIQNDYPTSADYGNYLLQAGVLEETKGSRK